MGGGAPVGNETVGEIGCENQSLSHCGVYKIQGLPPN